MITINLEKELIKANKKVMVAEELLLVKEYETNSELINDDSLTRVGLNKSIRLGKKTIDWHKKHEIECGKFKSERVFHISQIQETCEKYCLRFLPSSIYSGSIDKELPFKITNFEAAYGVKCFCHEVHQDPENNTYIMAPASSFQLEEKPKDPLFFYQINQEYYYLIHKWGNDLNLSRRFLGVLCQPWFYYLILVGMPVSSIAISIIGNVDFRQPINGIALGVNFLLLLWASSARASATN